MEISLIRHGRSKCTDNHRITCKEFSAWVEKYDYNGVYEENSYPKETIEKIATANIIFTSDLKRSIESANILKKKLKSSLYLFSVKQSYLLLLRKYRD